MLAYKCYYLPAVRKKTKNGTHNQMRGQREEKKIILPEDILLRYITPLPELCWSPVVLEVAVLALRRSPLLRQPIPIPATHRTAPHRTFTASVEGIGN